MVILKNIIGKRKKIIVIAPLILIVFYFVLYFFLKEFEVSKTRIEDLIKPLGLWGIVVAYVIQLAISLTPMPDTTSMLPIFFLFGPIEGGIIIIAGIQTAALLHYRISKKLGKKYILEKFPKAEAIAEKFSANMPLEALILVRVFSLVSFDVVAYLSGISNIPEGKFLIATTLALIPILTPNALIAYGLLAENTSQLLFAWLGTLAIVLVTAFVAKRSPVGKWFAFLKRQ